MLTKMGSVKKAELTVSIANALEPGTTVGFLRAFGLAIPDVVQPFMQIAAHAETIAKLLDDLGVDYIEGGYPGANPTDTDLFAQERKLGATFTAFGMTRRPGRSTSNDPGLATLLDAKADAICFVAKTWDYHVKVALETTNE